MTALPYLSGVLCIYCSSVIRVIYKGKKKKQRILIKSYAEIRLHVFFRVNPLNIK